MRSPRLCALLVPVLLCALVAVPTTRPPQTTDDGVGRREDGDSELSAQVVRLYEDAALATQRYEAGRQKAEMQRARARRFEELLARERQEIAVLHEDLGRIARSQYRDGGGLPLLLGPLSRRWGCPTLQCSANVPINRRKAAL